MQRSDILANEHLRVQFTGGEGTIDGWTLALRARDAWTPVGAGDWGRLVFTDGAGERQETAIALHAVAIDGASATLDGRYDDADGVGWTFRYTFTLDGNQIVARYHATPSAKRAVLHWTGPLIRVGAGAWGAHKTDALFPGVEYLIDDEPSSSSAFASATYSGRITPHPYKITIPLMAVSHDGIAVGLMWEPTQSYGSAWKYPATMFSSPNRLEGGDNHLLGLFVPGVPRFTEENTQEATRPFGVSPQNPLTLEARLVVLPDATSIDVVKTWVATYGLPTIEPPMSYRENVDLCVRSYLDVAWDEQEQGWHHTLADPWGPRYETRLIAQLWRYAQWPEGDPALRRRAREQVRAGLERELRKAPPADGGPVRQRPPHLELALHYGMLAESVGTLKAQVEQRLADQAPNGSWPWQRQLLHGGDFNTEERARLMGGEAGDSSTGLTAERALAVLRWARLTGDRRARDAGLRAVAWCNAQRRPEGAQTWELHLHVPDVLAAPYLIDINLDAFALTGDRSFVAQAERWAWTGLPFIYLWAAYYRPIMAYCSVPVFGVTFHDVQSWFGVDVQWNGLVFADALFRLAAHGHEADWRAIAEGITICGMQQQPTSGPWVGMYPDAISVVRGEEEYTWWLNPNLIGLNTFELAGIPLDITTHSLGDGDAAVQVTSGATIAEARQDGDGLVLSLRYPAGQASYTVIAARNQPRSVEVDGMALAENPALHEATSGWQWLEDDTVLLVKVPHDGDGTATLRVAS